MDPKQRNYLLLALCAILVIGSWVMLARPNGGKPTITQGLDIQGGLSVILQAKPSPGQTAQDITSGDMDKAELIINNRVNKLGASETSVQRQGGDALLVQLPGIKDQTAALKLIDTTGKLEFVDVSSLPSATIAAIDKWQTNGSPGGSARPVIPADVVYKPVLTGDMITNASAGQSSGANAGQITVTLTMDNQATDLWAKYTTANVGKQVAIVLDRVVQSAPAIKEPILSGNTEISGSFTVDEANNLATVLQTGSLPVTLEAQDVRSVGPTLGQSSLLQGVYAALVGLLIVAIYLIVFYRGMGVLSVVGLGVFASLFLGLLALLSAFGVFALSLPGIAGMVLTIGLAADSSILINERFREEIGMGKTVRSAAASGTKHAIITSADADIVTFVSALALFVFAIGPVKGFALTLMLGIVCDLIMMLLYSRPLIMLLGETVIPKATAFWGIPKQAVAARGVTAKKGGAANA
ncbi:MAG: protein translocase subunit SecD [Coriobacteriia bacterium]|nr:protein translocase subunit SecD [Coriobacteriia bacterium]